QGDQRRPDRDYRHQAARPGRRDLDAGLRRNLFRRGNRSRCQLCHDAVWRAGRPDLVEGRSGTQKANRTIVVTIWCSRCGTVTFLSLAGGDMSYYDLGTYSRPITTISPEAQLWFDRGLIWVYAYNHEEGIKCFRKALEHDSRCAMAHWGLAYAAG